MQMMVVRSVYVLIDILYFSNIAPLQGSTDGYSQLGSVLFSI